MIKESHGHSLVNFSNEELYRKIDRRIDSIAAGLCDACGAWYENPGYGSVKEGLQHVGSCRLAPEADAWPLAAPNSGEGFLQVPDDRRPS